MKVTDYLDTAEVLAQMAEEASELAQAALKLRRAYGGTNPTPRSVDECEANLLEELADIKVAFMALYGGDRGQAEMEVSRIADGKLGRWLERLEKGSAEK